jgi:(S)-ureidoglycine aminohydrolase
MNPHITPLGSTRTRVTPHHALICPDSHVQAPLPGWTNSKGIVLISPVIGARFTQFDVLMDAGAKSGPALNENQRFIYITHGTVKLRTGAAAHQLSVGSFAYLPPSLAHDITADTAARITVFEKRFTPLAGADLPTLIVGREQDIEATPFINDPHARLKLLLPDSPTFDMAVNIFTFDAGAALPLVETHIMEHGLLMLQGQGIYRLGDSWYPVQEGDVIWMASFCPQWFCAINPGTSRYLYYKDVNRDPLGGHR